tara:strand:+ start:236 stop:433 length:198 start_codon:yes stop_codon:yes gene_type:complete
MLEFLKIVLIIAYFFQLSINLMRLYFDASSNHYGDKAFKSKRQVLISLVPFGFLIDIYEHYKKLK